MNNRGFTLAELLITLGVVGVISALLGTALVNMQPDQDKIRYLKRFDSIKTSVNDLARNSRLFPVCQDNLSCKDHPLFNTAAGVSGRYTAIGDGDEKFCVGLSMMLNGRNLPNLNCTNQPIEYKDGADWTPSFETQNGTQWLVSTLRTLSGTSAVYQSDIYFDINGVDGPNCLYDSESCPVPDRFKVMVAANGTVIAADPVGQYYLTTRKNFKKRDLEIAENASVTENLNANLRNFTLTPCALEVASADSPVTPPAGGGNGSAVNPGDGESSSTENNDNKEDKEYYCPGDNYRGYIIISFQSDIAYKYIDKNESCTYNEDFLSGMTFYNTGLLQGNHYIPYPFTITGRYEKICLQDCERGFGYSYCNTYMQNPVTKSCLMEPNIGICKHEDILVTKTDIAQALVNTEKYSSSKEFYLKFNNSQGSIFTPQFLPNDNLISTKIYRPLLGIIFGADRNSLYVYGGCFSKNELDTYIDTYLE